MRVAGASAPSRCRAKRTWDASPPSIASARVWTGASQTLQRNRTAQAALGSCLACRTIGRRDVAIADGRESSARDLNADFLSALGPHAAKRRRLEVQNRHLRHGSRLCSNTASDD